MRVLEQDPEAQTAILSSSQHDENEHQNDSTLVTKNEEVPVTTNDEKRTIIDEIMKIFGDAFERSSLVWLNSIYEKAIELNCESESTLSSYITQAIVDSTELDDGLENIPDDVMARLLERVSKHKEDHIKDPELLAKVNDSFFQ